MPTFNNLIKSIAYFFMDFFDFDYLIKFDEIMKLKILISSNNESWRSLIKKFIFNAEILIS